MLSHFSHVRLFVAPWTAAPQVPVSMGFSRQEYWSGWVAMLSSRGSSRPRDQTHVSYVFCISRRVLYYCTIWEATIISQSLLKFMSIESVMLSNHPILCHPLCLLPSVFPSIRVFSNVSALHSRWPKYWSWCVSTPHLILSSQQPYTSAVSPLIFADEKPETGRMGISNSSGRCCSVTQLCLTLCCPMDCSTPDFSVLHCLPELAQTHVH